MSDFITLQEDWSTPWGFTFLSGTTFFRLKTTRSGRPVYAYGTPGGGEGTISLDCGQTPGN